MRITATPDAFFTLERNSGDSPRRISFFVKRDFGDAPAAEFIGELEDLFTLATDRPRELRQRFGLKGIYAALIILPTKARMHEIRNALAMARLSGELILSDLFWFAAESDLIREPNFVNVQWLPTAGRQTRPLVWNPSEWRVRDFQD